jgi:cytoskeletal protein CcmA (bactofilin family)
MRTEFTVDIDTPLTDDLYAVGREVSIDQDVAGDIVVIGGVVNIEGDVAGDVLVVGGKVNLYGNVGDDVRVFGGTVSLSGNVKDDVVVFAGTFDIAKNSTVGGSIFARGGMISLDGNISENVSGSGRFFKLKGWVNGNVEARAQDVVNISNSAKIKGDLSYYSRNPALIPDGVVSGKVQRVGEGYSRLLLLGFFSVGYFIVKFLQYLSLLLIGLLLFLLIPHEFSKMAEMVRKNFWHHLGIGFLVLTSGAAFALVSAMTVIGLPLALIVGLVLGIGWYLSPLVIGLFVGNLILQHKPRSNVKVYGVMALGMVLLFVIQMIPLLGSVGGFVLTLAGFGTLLKRTYELAVIVKGKR